MCRQGGLRKNGPPYALRTWRGDQNPEAHRIMSEGGVSESPHLRLISSCRVLYQEATLPARHTSFSLSMQATRRRSGGSRRRQQQQAAVTAALSGWRMGKVQVEGPSQHTMQPQTGHPLRCVPLQLPHEKMVPPLTASWEALLVQPNHELDPGSFEHGLLQLRCGHGMQRYGAGSAILPAATALGDPHQAQ